MVRRGRQFSWRRLQPYWHSVQTVVLIFAAFFVFTSGVFATVVSRLQNRSLYIASSVPGATTTYKVSFTFNTAAPVGSIDMQFCIDPIPSEPITANNLVDHHPCIAPTGIDVSNAVLSDQTGETGFTIATQTANHIVLSRPPATVGLTPSSYTFTNIVNPNAAAISHSYAIRLETHAASDASGPVIDLGSVITQVNIPITLETQVPPILIFCLAHTVSSNCAGNDNVYYEDMGHLSEANTLTAYTEMVAGTNASSGYVITVNGPPLEAGTHVITALDSPKPSAPGNLQFGINLRANSTPGVGADPSNAALNAQPTANYSTPNEFMYKDGDVIATAANVSLFQKFTVSYIVNVNPDLRAGVYTTTLTYICSGRF